MRKLTFFFLLLSLYANSQSEIYKIETVDKGVIEAADIKYSDNGQRLYIEQSNGEYLNRDKEDVISIATISDASQSGAYRIMTSDMEVINASNIRYSDSGNKILHIYNGTIP